MRTKKIIVESVDEYFPYVIRNIEKRLMFSMNIYRQSIEWGENLRITVES